MSVGEVYKIPKDEDFLLKIFFGLPIVNRGRNLHNCFNTCSKHEIWLHYLVAAGEGKETNLFLDSTRGN